MSVEIDGIKFPTLDEIIEVLESDKYKQTTGCLERLDHITGEVEGNCCLGVWARETGLPHQTNLTSSEFQFPDPFDQRNTQWCAGLPTPYFMSYYGMTDTGTPRVLRDKYDWDGVSLAGMNDDRKTFRMIAQKLREWKAAGYIHDPIKPQL